MSGLIVHSHGPLITATNFWELPEATLGKLLVSLNAGAFRVLLPIQAEGYLEDLRSAEGCAVSRGPWPELGLADGVEVLFDNGIPDPFALHLSVATFDRLPPDSQAGREVIVSCWTRPRRSGGGKPHLALQRPGYYRLVGAIPHLKPWRAPGDRRGRA
jgi:hypothetical protein